MTTLLAPAILSGIPGLIEVVFEIALKAAILCLVVWTLHIVAGRKRALLRSALWHLCLVGLIVVPASLFVGPRLHIATAIGGIPQASNDHADVVWESPSFDHDSFPAEGEPPLSIIARDSTTDHVDREAGTMSVIDHNLPPVASTPRLHLGEIAALVAGSIYLLVVGILLIRLTLALGAISALRRHGVSVDNISWTRALGRWHAQLGLRQAVALLQTERIGVPIVVGWRFPVILIPARLAHETDRQVIDAVLIHELTHVAREDYPWNVLLRIVCAVYWPHPGVWLVNRMVRTVREEVCDAVCIHRMGDVRAYCAILVEIASGFAPSSEVALALAMTRASRLCRRVLELERNPGIPRSSLGRPARAAVAIVLVAFSVLLGSLHFAASAAEEEKSREEPKPASGQSTSTIENLPDQTPEPIQGDLRSQNASGDQAGDKAAPGSPKSIKVKTVTIRRGSFENTIRVRGILKASGQVSIYPPRSGIVSKVMVEAGDKVRAGDVLAEFSVPDIEQKIAAGEAQVMTTQADLEIAKIGVVAAETAIESGKAALSQAAAELQRSEAAEAYKKKQFQRAKELLNLKSVDERVVDEREAGYLDAEGEVRVARAKLDAAKGDMKRVSAVDVPRAQASLNASKARAYSAQLELRRLASMTEEAFRSIRAPIDGVVLEKDVEPGRSMDPAEGKPLFRLATTNSIVAVANVSEQLTLNINRGDLASVSLFGTQPPVRGKISRIAYTTNSGTGSLPVEIDLPNSNGRMKPGMNATAIIIVGEEAADVLSVPDSALFDYDPNTMKATCVRIVHGHTELPRVKLKQDNGIRAEIAEGLKEGDVVVVDLKEPPADGQPVEIIPSDDQAEKR